MKEKLPITSGHTHLLNELRWLNRLLAAHVLRLRKVNFYEGLKDFRDFFVADEEIDELLAAGIFESYNEIDDEKRNKQISKLLEQAHKIREQINN
ncbi:hypothetical protein H8E88_07860 [candidate division KSB1 bacterium]|nr:hypothetical protein [candidate division KSB1 bacterium]